MSNIAVDDEGNTVEFNGSEWVPVRSAVNDDGERLQFVGGQWQPEPQPVPNTAEGIYARNLAKSQHPKVREQGEARLKELQQPLSAGFNDAGGYVSGLADQAIQGLTFGFGDEIKAAAQTARDYVTGGDGTYSDYVAQNRRGVQEFRNENPKSSIVSEGLGAVATAGGVPKLLAKKLPSVAGALMPKTLLRSTALGATEGAVYGAGVGEGQDKLESAAWGGLVGGVASPLAYGAGEVANRVLRNIPQLKNYIKPWTPDSPLAQKNIADADSLGIKLHPSQVTGSRTLEKVESNIKRNPLGGAGFDRVYDNNQQQVQRIVNKELGLPGTEVDIGKARQINNAAFDAVGNTGVKIDLDRSFLKDVATAKRGYEKAWGRTSKAGIFTDIKREIDKGQISAKRYKYLMSQLSSDLHKASVAGDGARVQLYGSLQTALDKAADRSIPQANTAFHKARRAFQVLKLIERPGVVNPGTQEVSIAKLANAHKRDKAFIRGLDQTPLATSSRLQHAFKTGIPDSGTPTGSPLGMMLSPAYYVGSHAYTALPNSVWGSTGAGKKAAQIAPFALSPALDSYRKEGRER